jgi:hypothetical protein
MGNIPHELTHMDRKPYRRCSHDAINDHMQSVQITTMHHTHIRGTPRRRNALISANPQDAVLDDLQSKLPDVCVSR